MNKKPLLNLLLSAVLISTAIAVSPAAISLVASGSRPVMITQRLAPGNSFERSAQLLTRHNGTTTRSQDESNEVEVITATPNGFEPAVITRPRGPFILAFHNNSGARELVLRISRTRGEQLYELRVRVGRSTQHQRLDLPPGNYVISEANHPEWSCALTITR